MKGEDFFSGVEEILAKEPRLIKLPSRGKAVFVGDTHGDLEASERVIHRFLEKKHTIVFLGDYVDRGEFSKENVDYLLHVKREKPDKIFLLAGNHEGYGVKQFNPADFWDALSPEERGTYERLFSKFALAATSANGILALHGALPDLKSLKEFDQIERGSENWDRIVWGDFADEEGEHLGDRDGRPRFGSAYFYRIMERYEKQVLVRSHQPHAPPFMYDKRCVTLFTSKAYLPIRTVAVADLEKEIKTGTDLLFEKI